MNSNGIPQQVKRKALCFPRNLMRTTLSHARCTLRGELSIKMKDNRTTLRRIWTLHDQRDLYNRINHLMHMHNSDWFQYLKVITDSKLQSFSANVSEQTQRREISVEDNGTSDVGKVLTSLSENPTFLKLKNQSYEKAWILFHSSLRLTTL